jgi:hypothetical protein
MSFLECPFQCPSDEWSLGKCPYVVFPRLKTSFENGPLNYSPRRQCPIRKNVLSSRMNAELGENETSDLFDHNG